MPSPPLPSRYCADKATSGMAAQDRQRDFRSHLLVYILVNTFLVVIWPRVTDPHGSSGRCFPIAGWVASA